VGRGGTTVTSVGTDMAAICTEPVVGTDRAVCWEGCSVVGTALFSFSAAHLSQKRWWRSSTGLPHCGKKHACVFKVAVADADGTLNTAREGAGMVTDLVDITVAATGTGVDTTWGSSCWAVTGMEAGNSGLSEGELERKRDRP
jgi:hypothetical protein